MLFLPKHECEKFAETAGISKNVLSAVASDSAFAHAIHVDLQNERHRSYYLATEFISLLGQYHELLVWVVEFGIWPSSENRHMYYQLRRSYGDSGKLNEAAGHLFDAQEREACITFLHLALEFGWGVYIISKPLNRWIFASHDGWARVVRRSTDTDALKDVEAWSVPYDVEKGGAEPPPALH